MKNQYRGGLPKNGRIAQFADLRGGLQMAPNLFKSVVFYPYRTH